MDDFISKIEYNKGRLLILLYVDIILKYFRKETLHGIM